MQMTGGAAQNIPGFISSQSEQERLKTGIGAGYQVHQMTDAAGRVIPTFGINLQGFPGAPGMQPSQTMGPVQAPPSPRPFASPGAQPQPNPADPWSTMPKLEMPTGLGQTTYQKGIAEQQSATAGKLTTKYGEISEQASQRKAFNDQALSLVDQADTGPKAVAIADVKNWLVSRFHVPESHFENTPSATTALQKDLVNAATQKAKQQFGSRITQSEVQLMLTRASPNVDMTKAAMRYLIQSDNAQLDYQIGQGAGLEKYLKSGGDPLHFETWYAKTFPMTNTVGAVHLQSGAPKAEATAAPKYTDADLKHTAMKHGITVEEVRRRLGAQ
jgi:hypothetical protein